MQIVYSPQNVFNAKNRSIVDSCVSDVKMLSWCPIQLSSTTLQSNSDSQRVQQIRLYNWV